MLNLCYLLICSSMQNVFNQPKKRYVTFYTTNYFLVVMFENNFFHFCQFFIECDNSNWHFNCAQFVPTFNEFVPALVLGKMKVTDPVWGLLAFCVEMQTPHIFFSSFHIFDMISGGASHILVNHRCQPQNAMPIIHEAASLITSNIWKLKKPQKIW